MDRRKVARLPELAWLATAGLAALFALSCSPVRIPESGSRRSIVFYACPADLRRGARMDPDELEGRLGRLGYHKSASVEAPEQYRRRGDTWDIWLSPSRDVDGEHPGGPIRLLIQGGRIVAAETPGGGGTALLHLEPERIASYEGGTAALVDPLRLEDAPPLLVEALVAVEDRRFWHHAGIDPAGMLRAAWVNLRSGERRQGGSTLTQQLARSLFLSNSRTFDRKLREAAIALRMEARYSKEEILEAYLNAIYWGSWGAMEIRGASEAARYYLRRDLAGADAADIALLVGLLRAPNAYSPYASPEKALRRRDQVLRVLEEQGVLDAKEAARARAKPLPATRPPDRVADATYFLDAAREEIERRAPEGTLGRTDLAIYTTLDPRDQAAAIEAVRDGTKRLERDHPSLRRKKEPLQGAAVVLDPATGEVRALAGGRDPIASPFNRAVNARRQPGSLFKPFVYLAALRRPFREDGSAWTVATVLPDEPFEIGSGRRVYRPQNYDHEFRGEVTVRTALEQSINVPTAWLANEIGVRRVAETARDLGIRSKLQEVPSLALGSSEVTLLEITAAYAALANGGAAREPVMVRGILASDGRALPLLAPEHPPGVGEQEAYLLTTLLEGVIDQGTGARARSLGVQGEVAGKTGTTDDYRDAWFAGYTPRRAVGVWVGFDRVDVTGLTGASAALPLWAAIMRRVQAAGGDGEFTRPPSLVMEVVDSETGAVATEKCPAIRAELFIAGTEPVEPCTRHSGFLGWFRRNFDL